MNGRRAHPALTPDATGRVCANPRCSTLLPVDVEICDECGGTRFERLERMPAFLCGWADERPVVFKLEPGRAAVIGRSTPDGPTPEIDLQRLPGSRSVHRRHAELEADGDLWRITQLGTNSLMVVGRERTTLRTGASTAVRHGDTIDVSGIRLTLVVRESGAAI